MAEFMVAEARNTGLLPFTEGTVPSVNPDVIMDLGCRKSRPEPEASKVCP